MARFMAAKAIVSFIPSDKVGTYVSSLLACLPSSGTALSTALLPRSALGSTATSIHDTRISATDMHEAEAEAHFGVFRSAVSHNHMHGILLQIQHLLHRFYQSSFLQQVPPRTALALATKVGGPLFAHRWLLGPSMSCFTIRAVYHAVLDEYVRFLTCLSVNSNIAVATDARLSHSLSPADAQVVASARVGAATESATADASHGVYYWRKLLFNLSVAALDVEDVDEDTASPCDGDGHMSRFLMQIGQKKFRAQAADIVGHLVLQDTRDTDTTQDTRGVQTSEGSHGQSNIDSRPDLASSSLRLMGGEHASKLVIALMNDVQGKVRVNILQSLYSFVVSYIHPTRTHTHSSNTQTYALNMDSDSGSSSGIGDGSGIGRVGEKDERVTLAVLLDIVHRRSGQQSWLEKMNDQIDVKELRVALLHRLSALAALARVASTHEGAPQSADDDVMQQTGSSPNNHDHNGQAERGYCVDEISYILDILVLLDCFSSCSSASTVWDSVMFFLENEWANRLGAAAAALQYSSLLLRNDLLRFRQDNDISQSTAGPNAFPLPPSSMALLVAKANRWLAVVTRLSHEDMPERLRAGCVAAIALSGVMTVTQLLIQPHANNPLLATAVSSSALSPPSPSTFTAPSSLHRESESVSMYLVGVRVHLWSILIRLLQDNSSLLRQATAKLAERVMAALSSPHHGHPQHMVKMTISDDNSVASGAVAQSEAAKGTDCSGDACDGDRDGDAVCVLVAGVLEDAFLHLSEHYWPYQCLHAYLAEGILVEGYQSLPLPGVIPGSNADSPRKTEGKDGEALGGKARHGQLFAKEKSNLVQEPVLTSELAGYCLGRVMSKLARCRLSSPVSSTSPDGLAIPYEQLSAQRMRILDVLQRALAAVVGQSHSVPSGCVGGVSYTEPMFSSLFSLLSHACVLLQPPLTAVHERSVKANTHGNASFGEHDDDDMVKLRMQCMAAIDSVLARQTPSSSLELELSHFQHPVLLQILARLRAVLGANNTEGHASEYVQYPFALFVSSARTRLYR